MIVRGQRQLAATPCSRLVRGDAEGEHRHPHLRDGVGRVALEPLRVGAAAAGDSVRTWAWSDSRRCGSAGAGEHEGAAHVDVEHQVVALRLEVGDRCEVDRGGVVDHDVDAAELLDGLRDGASTCGVVADVADDRQRLAARRLDLLGGRVDRSRAASDAAVSVLASSATSRPRAGAATAIARPMPRLPPDITTTRPESGEDMRRHASGPRADVRRSPAGRLGCKPCRPSRASSLPTRYPRCRPGGCRQSRPGSCGTARTSSPPAGGSRGPTPAARCACTPPSSATACSGCRCGRCPGLPSAGQGGGGPVPRRVNLPTADDLFRPTAPADDKPRWVRAVPDSPDGQDSQEAEVGPRASRAAGSGTTRR